MAKRCVTLLLQKYVIGENNFVYLPVKISEGHIDSERNFLDLNGTCFNGLLASASNGMEPDLVYLDVVPLLYPSEFAEKFGENKLEDILDGYVEKNRQTMYFLSKNASTVAAKVKAVNIREIEDEMGLELKNILSIEVKDSFEKRMADFSTCVASDNVTKEQLESIGEEVSFYKDLVDDLLENIDFRLGMDELIAEVQPVIDSYIETHKTEKTKSELYKAAHVIDIDDLVTKLKKTIVGQDEAVIRMVTEITRLDSERGDSDGILLSGPSGSGKTLLLSLIAKNLDRPFLFIDSTQLSVPGLAGKHIEEYLWDLYVASGKNLSKAEKAIVVFDEIDKRGVETSHPSNNVINTLLKFLDGTVYRACASTQDTRSENTINISTKDMIVIAAGAFTSVYKKSDHRVAGFGNVEKSCEKVIATPEDFITKGGMSREFMGRNPVLIKMNSLNTHLLERIILESDTSALLREKRRFGRLGVNLEADPSYVSGVAERAYNLKVGARGIRGIILDSTYMAYHDANSNIGKYSEIILDKSTLDDPKSYVKVNK